MIDGARARSAGEQVAEHLVAAVMAHIRQLHRDGVPVPPGLLDLAAMLAKARQSPPSLDARPARPQPSPMPPVSVDYAAAAAMLGVSRRTVSRRVAAGELPVTGTGRGRRILVAGLAAEESR